MREKTQADALRAASPLGVDYPSNIAFTTRMSGAIATGQGPQAVFNDTPDHRQETVHE